MTLISRRQFAFGASAAMLAGPSPSLAQSGSEASDGRVAIIDTHADTRPYLRQLKERNVRVVGRYYARDCQPVTPNKRMAFNGRGYVCGGRSYAEGGASEARQLLANGFGILSIFQYNSSNPCKLLFGLRPDGGAIRTGRRGMDHLAVARHEAMADAATALAQAADVGQPDGTAIYFTLDFNLKSGADLVSYFERRQSWIARYQDGTPVQQQQLEQACIAYFRTLKERIGSRYQLGVYGNGHACRTLKALGLVKYTWLSGSLSYHRTSEFLRSNDWHLFQNQLDRAWFLKGEGCRSGLDVDTNIQNPTQPDFGAWHAGGLFTVNGARTRTIFSQRWIARTRTGIHVRMDRGAPLAGEEQCKSGSWISEQVVREKRNVRVVRDHGAWLEVDCNEDGASDGFCPKGNNFLTSLKQMPDY